MFVWTGGGAAPAGVLGPSSVGERVALLLAERFGTAPPTAGARARARVRRTSRSFPSAQLTAWSAGMAERYLAAESTRVPPHGVPEGELRRADIRLAADGALLAGWCEAFEDDLRVEPAMRKPGAERLQDYRSCSRQYGLPLTLCLSVSVSVALSLSLSLWLCLYYSTSVSLPVCPCAFTCLSLSL